MEAYIILQFYRAMIRQIIKPEDVVTTRSRDQLEKLELQDLDLILREALAGKDIRSPLGVQ